MSHFLYENHRGSPTLTLLNVLGVLGVLNVLNVLYMPMDAPLACWALFIYFCKQNIITIAILHSISITSTFVLSRLPREIGQDGMGWVTHFFKMQK